MRNCEDSPIPASCAQPQPYRRKHAACYSDERVRRLASEFGAAWLHLHGFDTLDEKSERHFPTFRDLRGAMYEESIRFFTDFFTNNRSVLSLLDADHTFLNEALAKHYGIPGVAGPEWRRVDGIAQFGRGGILGQAAVLSKQSGASRTSPILRGNWIAEVLLGDKLPRPPKDVPQLPPDEATETLSMREADREAYFGPPVLRLPRPDRPLRIHARTLRRDRPAGATRISAIARSTTTPHSRTASKSQGIDGLRNYLLTKAATRSCASSAGSFSAIPWVAPCSFPTNLCSTRWKRSSSKAGIMWVRPST